MCWYLENFKPHSLVCFFFLPKDLSPCASLTPFPWIPRVSSQVLELVCCLCSRLFSAHCKTTQCIFLVHGSFPCHIPKQLGRTDTQCWKFTVRDVCICVFLLIQRQVLGVNVNFLNFSSAQFYLIYLLLSVLSLSLLFQPSLQRNILIKINIDYDACFSWEMLRNV